MLTFIPEEVAPWLTVADEGEMLITKSGEGGGGRTSPDANQNRTTTRS
jgi:hypothetical protein